MFSNEAAREQFRRRMEAAGTADERRVIFRDFLEADPEFQAARAAAAALQVEFQRAEFRLSFLFWILGLERAGVLWTRGEFAATCRAAHDEFSNWPDDAIVEEAMQACPFCAELFFEVPRVRAES